MALSKTCACASPPPRRRRRSPRPCRWSRPRSCGARRWPPRRRVPMRSAWARCWATSRPRSPGSTSAPALLRGTGSDQTHLLLVCTAERGLCGPFNSAIVRLARERANALIAEGKDGQVLLRRPQGLRADSPQLREADHRASRTARVRTITFEHAEAIARKDRQALRGGRVRRLHAVLLALQVGDRADPTAQQIIPPVFETAEAEDGAAARPTSTSPRKRKFSPSSCRATSRCRFSARSWRTPHRSTARR